MNWKEELKSYPDNEDMVQLYEDWGDMEYLKEIFGVLNAYEPDWNKQCELGSWAAEFILDLLADTEEELENMSSAERIERFNELLDERYEDFRGMHQFTRQNNLRLQSEDGLAERMAADNDTIGFPVLL